MKKYFLYILLLFYVNNVFCQKHFFKFPIYVDLNQQYIESFNKIDSSIVSDISSAESSNLKLYDFVSKKIKIIFIDTVNKEKIVGTYLILPKIEHGNNSVIPIGAGGLHKRKVIIFYFQNAVRFGKWTIYDEQNKIKKVIEYTSPLSYN